MINMKKTISPAVGVGSVVLILAIVGGVWFYMNRDLTSNSKPLDDTNTYKTVGGRRLPGMAGGGGAPSAGAEGDVKAGAKPE